MAVEYVIKIQNDLKVEQQTGVPNPTGSQSISPPKGKISQSVSKTIATQLGKQALQFAISNYGNLSGDYMGQSNINGLVEVGGMITMVATGYVGAAIALSSLTIKTANYYLDRTKQNQQASMLAERVGLK